MARNNAKSLQILSSARHPLETEVVTGVRILLEQNRWPAERLEVHVDFSMPRGKHSDHSLKRVKMRNGHPTGTVMLTFNYLHLQQRPAVFFSQVIPHEVAHVFSALAAMRAGEKIEPHGEEWKTWYMKLGPGEPLKPSALLSHFDDRPHNLHKGGITVRCSCAGDAGFDVAIGKALSDFRDGNLICKQCGEPFAAATETDIPAVVLNQLQFIRGEACHR